MKKVAFHTLGCKLNFSESSEIGRQLAGAGFERVQFGTPADVTVIHTCSVTGSADRKTRQAIHKAVKVSPEGFIVAMGCLAQLQPEKVASWPGVDLVLGTSDKFDLIQYLDDIRKKPQAVIHSCDISDDHRFFPAHSSTERTRAFLKVQDGCDYLCSYCTIPRARGMSRNPPIRELAQEAALLASEGFKEIVLTGVNTGDFGKSTGESFTTLVRALDQVQGVIRFRISSIEPNLITDELLEFVARSERFAPHFHIPLQSGSDKILKRMRRRYLTSDFSDRVNKIRELMPDACIGADIITGFPGESDADFEETCSFVSSLPISYLHVFTYSERPGTLAARMPGRVPERIRDQRSQILHQIGSQLKTTFYQSLAGQDHLVLLERVGPDGTITGFTNNYAEVRIPGKKDWEDSVAWIRIGAVTDGMLTGEILSLIS